MHRRELLSLFLSAPGLMEASRTAPDGTGQEAEWLGTMSGLLAQNRWDALLALAQRVYAAAPHGASRGSAREVACYLVFQAHLVLAHHEDALLAGELYLEQYPEGLYAFAVRLNLRVLREREAAQADALASVREDLERIERELSAIDAQWASARLEPSGDSGHPERFAQQRAATEFQVCSLLSSRGLSAHAVQACSLFTEKHQHSEDAQIQLLARSALFLAMMQEAQQGHFQEARKLGARLQAWAPQFAREHSISTLMSVWPT